MLAGAIYGSLPVTTHEEAEKCLVKAIAFNPKTGMLEAGVDGRDTDGAAVGLDAPPAAAKTHGTGGR